MEKQFLGLMAKALTMPEMLAAVSVFFLKKGRPRTPTHMTGKVQDLPVFLLLSGFFCYNEFTTFHEGVEK